MSINPVPAVGPAADGPSAGSGHRAVPSPSAAERTASALDSGVSPKAEAIRAGNVSAPPAEPQDEVQVQRDSETNGEIVIRYLDRSGDVILQVPSSQMLALTRAIDQNLQQEAKVRATASDSPTADKGDDTYGD
ncbi:MAG TPA: hypothetical protein VGM18_02610 [Candidatus Sulfotelmatobacter sp.]